VYVVSKLPTGGRIQKCKVTVFLIKLHFSQRKSAIKFLRAKTVNGKVVKHLLACLTLHKWLVGDVPLNVNFVHKVNQPLA